MNTTRSLLVGSARTPSAVVSALLRSSRLLCLALLLPFVATAKLPAVTESKLGNGLTVLTRFDRSVPLCAVRFVSRAGSRYDPAGAEGTASLLSDTLMLGAGTRSEADLDRELERNGAVLDAVVGNKSLVVSGDVPTIGAGGLPALLELLADVVTVPTFPAGPVERARERALAGLRRVSDDRLSLAERAFAATVFAAHPYGRPADGSLASVASLTPAALKAFHASWVRPERSILGLAGDCDPKVVAGVLKKRFGAWVAPGAVPTEPALPPVAEVPPRLVLVDTGDATLNQAQLRIGAPLRRTYSDPEYLAYHVSAEVLGGDFSARLNDELRVKAGLTYGAKWLYQLDDSVSRAGYVWTFTGLRDAVRAVDLSFDTVDAYRKGAATEAELTRVKSRLAKAFPFRFETNGQVLAELLQLWLDNRPREVLETYPERVAALDAAALDAVDADVDLSRATVGVVGNTSARAELEALAQRRGLAFSVLTLEELGLR